MHRLTGSRLGTYHREYLAQDRARKLPDSVAALGETLRHAVSSVPYYREVAGTEPGRIDDPVAFLRQLPILTKETIRDAGEQLLSSVGDRNTWYENATGGSTGEPLKLIQDADHRARIVAIQEVYSTWAGGGLGRPEVFIWGSERDIEVGSETLRNRLANAILNRKLLNAFRLDEASMRRFLAVVQRGPSKLVLAYSQAGFEVARFAAAERIGVPPQRGFIATAGMLYDHMRSRIEETFGCRVFDRYGSREIGDMAGECEHGTGLHVLPWCCYIEVVDDDDAPTPPGVEGDIVVTGLTNRAMPLIRYRIGDRAVLAADEVCPCGRAGPRLARVTGRTVDMFLTETGVYVAGGYFVQLLAYRPWVGPFQIRQTAPDEVEYLVVARGEIPEGDREEIERATRAALGAACRVSFRLVDEIDPGPSGKRHYTRRLF
jgi:phenylacetate-CoA ligase